MGALSTKKTNMSLTLVVGATFPAPSVAERRVENEDDTYDIANIARNRDA